MQDVAKGPNAMWPGSPEHRHLKYRHQCTEELFRWNPGWVMDVCVKLITIHRRHTGNFEHVQNFAKAHKDSVDLPGPQASWACL